MWGDLRARERGSEGGAGKDVKNGRCKAGGDGETRKRVDEEGF